MTETKIINYNPAEGCRVEWNEGPRDMSADVMGVQIARIEDSANDMDQHKVWITKWGSDSHCGPLIVEGSATLHAMANVGDYKVSIDISDGFGVWAELRCLKTNKTWPVKFKKDKALNKWIEYKVFIEDEEGADNQSA